MILEFLNKDGGFNCEIKAKLTPKLLSMIIEDTCILKEGIELDEKVYSDWVTKLNNGITIMSPQKLICGIRVG